MVWSMSLQFRFARYCTNNEISYKLENFYHPSERNRAEIDSLQMGGRCQKTTLLYTDE
jgi:hypothetical protein